MYSTYYIQSSGQPKNNIETHEQLEDALSAWVSNCGALFKASGGKSALVGDGGVEDLYWIEGAQGGYATGTMATEDSYDTPAETAKAIADDANTDVDPLDARKL